MLFACGAAKILLRPAHFFVYYFYSIICYLPCMSFIRIDFIRILFWALLIYTFIPSILTVFQFVSLIPCLFLSILFSTIFLWLFFRRCLEDEMNGKHERMKLVARQSQLLSSITELAVSLRRPPQDVVPALFLRLNVSLRGNRVDVSLGTKLKRLDVSSRTKHRGGVK